MKIFNTNLDRRKKLLSAICRKDRRWPVYMVFHVFCELLAIAVAVGSVWLILLTWSVEGIEAKVAIFGACIVCILIPFIVGVSLKNSAKYNCGFPYTSMVNGALILDGEKLEYIFWRAGKRMGSAYSYKNRWANRFSADDRHSYTIERDQVENIVFDNMGTCTVKGKGRIFQPYWEFSDYRVKNGEVETGEFSFLMCFDTETREVAEAIKEWRNGVQ